MIIVEMEKFAKGIINETLERHKFSTKNQKEGEIFDDFLTELNYLAKLVTFAIQKVVGKDCYETEL